MNKKPYILPAIAVLPFRAAPLMAGSPLQEGKTESGGGIHDEEVEEGLSRQEKKHNIWDDEDELELEEDDYGW